ncbi:ribonucleoside-triphosphate reductase [Candidatus Woesearchaeota archaeon]|nr:ribonucleoside-triphosphate reductase [Candidatus Woesearchaeota archaeon]
MNEYEGIIEGSKGIFDLTQVRKRTGELVPFDVTKISGALYRAMDAVRSQGIDEGVDMTNDPIRIADNVVQDLKVSIEAKRGNGRDYVPEIEEIQNWVERNLILAGFPDTAKAYILYRNQRSQIRKIKSDVPEKVKRLAEESRAYFKDNPLGEFVFYRTYSRWMEDEGRRETWVETVDRYIDFMKDNLDGRLTEDDNLMIRNSILNHKALPSMRLLWSAGKAAEASNVTAYNCSFTTPTEINDFGEIMYLLMCGTGVGFSVENQFTQQLPIIHKQRGEPAPAYIIEDSKEGWSKALVHGMKLWYNGDDVKFDYSKLRPAGSRLKTMGGRSSGPDPLRALLNYTRDKILKNQGRRLNSLDVHDIICKTGDIVVVGGVRRSAEISLSDLDDILMRDAKIGDFYNRHPERSLANNSAVYLEKPGTIEFMREWLALAESGTGERGIFNRGGLLYQLPERRVATLDEHLISMGTNPCGEINLRAKQFCNLTEVVARAWDTLETLREKIKVATILGTYQSMLTNFSFLSHKWKENCEEERLLGVSITGIMDCSLLQNPEVLETLRDYAVEVNRDYSKIFGINPSTCVTCVKPSGTASKIVNSSEGSHPRWNQYYLQNIRINANDPLFHMLKDQKYPYSPEVGQSIGNATTFVLPFAVKSPDGAVVRKDLNAITQLEHWKRLKNHYTEHNPSVSIYIGNDEWVDAAQWIHRNWESIGGLAFFPRDDNDYQLAPKEDIDEAGYHELRSRLPAVDYSAILHYEKDDQTMGAREYACIGGSCQI